MAVSTMNLAADKNKLLKQDNLLEIIPDTGREEAGNLVFNKNFFKSNNIVRSCSI
jgi:hypothetical protein